MSNTKKKKILTTGKNLFWKHGFKRVTVEEICAEAEVSKMTFYKFFSNKMELVKAIMEQNMKEALDRYKKIMESDKPFREKIQMQIQMKMEGTSDISAEFLDDLIIHGEPELMEYMKEMSSTLLTMVYSDYVEAQKRGEIRRDLKPEFIIYFLNHMYEMLKDESLVHMYKDPHELAMELVRFFFYGILERNDRTE